MSISLSSSPPVREDFRVVDPLHESISRFVPGRRSAFYGLVVNPGRVIDERIFVDEPGNGYLTSFRYSVGLSDFALDSICSCLDVPRGLVPRSRGFLINFVELLVRVMADIRFGRGFLRSHYYYLLCDSRNRAHWRFVVEEDARLPVTFTQMVGFRACLQYYPARLFALYREGFQVFYCSFVRGFMRLVADSFARETGLMGSEEADAARFGTSLSFLSSVRRDFHNLARCSLNGSPFDWCPDVFDGLGAHASPDWFRRDFSVVGFLGAGYLPSVGECVFVGSFVRTICRRFPGLHLYPLFAALLSSFSRFLEDFGDRDEYLVGGSMSFQVETLVLRSGMLSLWEHWGFLRWLGSSLPRVGVSAGPFVTPPDFVGADLSMQNFGGGGHVAIVERSLGMVRPMVVNGFDVFGFRYGSLFYSTFSLNDEDITLVNLFTGNPVVLDSGRYW
jgi:hypothetical protein